MFKILMLLTAGIAVGYLLSNTSLPHKAEKGIQITIYAMLFVFGISIGASHELINNLGQFGWKAAVIAVMGILGSLIAARAAQKILNKNKGGNEK